MQSADPTQTAVLTHFQTAVRSDCKPARALARRHVVAGCSVGRWGHSDSFAEARLVVPLPMRFGVKGVSSEAYLGTVTMTVRATGHQIWTVPRRDATRSRIPMGKAGRSGTWTTKTFRGYAIGGREGGRAAMVLLVH